MTRPKSAESQTDITVSEYTIGEITDSHAVAERKRESSPQVQGQGSMHWVRRPTSRRLDSLACLSPEVGTACAASLHRDHRRRRQPARARVPWKGTGSPRRRMTWVLGISAGELRTHEKSLGWLYCVSHTCMLQPELFYVILVGPTSSTTLDISTSPETLLRPPSLNDI